MQQKSSHLLIHSLAMSFAMIACGLANAEERGIFPRDMPASYKTECASCHEAPPPDMLTADPWQEIMLTLGNHWGTDASINDPKSSREINLFLQSHAYPGQSSSMRPMRNGDPLKVTTTLFFHRTHGRVKAHFHDSRVVSPFNCSACHILTDKGGYEATSLTPLARKFLSQ